jgi:hypothetical protein
VNLVQRLLLGTGQLPTDLRAELAAEQPVVIVEGLTGVVTLRHYRAPGRRYGIAKSAVSGAVAVTRQSLVVWAGRQKQVDVPLDHPLRGAVQLHAEGLDQLLVTVDDLSRIFEAPCSRNTDRCWAGPCQQPRQGGGGPVSGRAASVVGMTGSRQWEPQAPQETTMQTFDTPTPITAIIEIAAGHIQLIATDRADTTVEVSPTNPTRNRTTADNTTITHTDGVLRIHTTQPHHQLFGPSGSLDITIALPAGSHIQATTASTELRSTGRLGHVVFDGAYRQISIAETASLRLTAVDGDIQVGRLGGPAQISTARGDIHITEAARGKVVLGTQSGDITIGAVTGVSAALHAATSHGRIDNTLNNDGTTELDIHATTPHGDINAHSV